MSYIGDIALSKTFDTKFTTVGTTGAPTTLAGSPVISAYVDNSTTQITAGITLTVDFDGVTGLHNIRVVATGANGYAAGSNYQLVITTGTVGGTSVVGYVVAEFSIEARSSLRPTTADRTLDVSAGGEAGLDWANIGSPTTAQNLSSTNIDVDQVVASVSGAVGSVAAGGITAASIATDAIDADALADGAITAATFAAGAINAAAIATDAITAAKIAADAIGASELAADAITEIQSGLATAAALDTVDNFIDTEIAAIITTLGTPAGVSISADIAAIEAQTDDIGTAGVGLTAIPWNAAWDAEVQSEVDDALVAQNLDHLVKIAVDTDFATTVHLNSVVGHLADNGTSATFDRTTDSLEALEGKIDTVDNFLDTEIAAIQADTDDIQTRLPAALVSGRIDASVGAMAADVITASAIATDAIGSAELAASAVTEIQTGLSTLTAAQVNAEVLDVLNVDTFAQPGQENPAATTTLANMLKYLYKAFRNKKTQTATTMSLFADDAATVDQKATISDDGTTYTHSEISTGP